MLQCDITDSSLQKADKPVEIYWNAQLEFLRILLTYASDTHTGCSDFMCGVCNQIFGCTLMEDLPVQNL